jgi:hypothetical protein
MLEQTKMRTLPVVNRAADFAPAAQACCGFCRTCTTTNIVGLTFAGLGGLGVYLGRFARRLARTG